MPKITKIYPLPANPPKYPEARVLVYIDGIKCTIVRERTWSAMDLHVGDPISCEELKEREKFHWKHEYQKSGGWEQEKVRISAVKSYLESIDHRIEAVVTGFGANSTEFIAEHPDEKGRPDIEVTNRQTKIVLLFAEVTGTENPRGSTYWVRPDKIEYALNHPTDDVWIIFHYLTPQEKMVFFKPKQQANYTVKIVMIRGSGENMIELTDESPGVVTEAEFRSHLLSLL